MEDFLDKYTAREFLEWLENEQIDEYLIPVVVKDEMGTDETFVVNMVDVELLKKQFMSKVHRYEVVVRGYTFYIHDNKTCHDIISWRFTDDNREQAQATADNVCKNLNNGVMSFISHEKHCF